VSEELDLYRAIGLRAIVKEQFGLLLENEYIH
jgi:hypothetical protein